MDKYQQTIQKLRNYRPTEESTEGLKGRILRGIPGDNRQTLTDFLAGKLFGWTEVVWLRRSMVVFSLVITIMFVMQQFTVYERISSIEDRIISITTENILDFQKEAIHASNAIYKLNSEMFTDDSLMVSGKDLGALVRSYRELQSRYEELQSIIDAGETVTEIEGVPGRDKLKL